MTPDDDTAGEAADRVEPTPPDRQGRPADGVDPAWVGQRISVRCRRPDGLLADTVGVLERADATRLWVRRRTGEVSVVDRSAIRAARRVEPKKAPSEYRAPGELTQP